MQKITGYLLFALAVLAVVFVAFRVNAIRNLVMPVAKSA